HSTPRTLTVVSSDRRIRQAADRRKAVAVTAEAFWETLDARKERQRPVGSPLPSPEPPRDRPPSSEDAAHWLREFADLDDQPETREALGGSSTPLLTDA